MKVRMLAIPVVLISAIVATLAGITVVGYIITGPPAKFKAIREGMTQDEVRRILGPPFRESSADMTQRDFRSIGYQFPSHRVSHKAMVYLDGDNALYVYIADDGKVEYTYLGKS